MNKWNSLGNTYSENVDIKYELFIFFQPNVTFSIV